MKILFVLDSLELGGAERQALLLAEALRDKGHDIAIWGFGSPGAVSRLCEQKGFSCSSREHPHLLRGRDKLSALHKLARDMRALRPDVILPFGTYPSTFSALVWRFTGAGACIWNQRDAGLYAGLHAAYPFAVNLASAAIANSAEGAGFLQERGCRKSVALIHNGVSLPAADSDRSAWRARLGIGEDAPAACMLANLSAFKNHDVLLRAWRYGVEAGLIPPKAFLLLAGRFDGDTEHLRKMAENFGIAGQVKFLGQVDDVSGLLAAVDIGVLSSLSEGLPNAVLEYMRAGLPIVASDISGVREALGEESPNALFSAASEQACAAALGAMLHDAALREKASLYNQARVSAHFSVDAMTARYLELFARALEKTPLSVWLDIARWAGKKGIDILKRGSKKMAKMALGRHIYKVRACIESLHANSPFAFKVARTVPDNPKIGFAVLAHERPEYLRICLDTLFASDISGWDITFLIHDDGSADPAVRRIIEEPRGSEYTIARVYKSKGHNSWGAAFNSAMRELRKLGDFDILGSCDSDALFHPQWLQKTLPLCIWAKKHHKHNILGPFSPFNSSDIAFHKSLGVYDSPSGKYIIKERMGALVYLWFKDDLKIFGTFEENRDDETIKTKEFVNKRIRNFSSSESYVEHIGEDSILNLWRPQMVPRAVHALNLVQCGWPDALAHAGTLGYFRSVASRSGMFPHNNSQRTLDVVIPATEKDLPTLSLVINGVRRNLAHPIGRIFVVSPITPAIRDVVRREDAVLIDEREVLPLAKQDIQYTVSGMDRSGWLLQQFIKLNADLLTPNEHFLVIDADTVLVRRQVFEEENKTILLVADEYHQPYYKVFMRLLGFPPSCAISFVSHMMSFEAGFLRELRNSLEERSRKSWFESILSQIDKTQPSGFSEFELYGHWMLCSHPEIIKREYFMNCALNRDKLDSIKCLEEHYGMQFRSVSFHSYIN